MLVERSSRPTRVVADFDRQTPVLVVRIGHYPLHAGTLGVLRSLGRVGASVYTMAEDRFTPAAVSRFVAGSFVAPTSGTESEERLLALLVALGRRIGTPASAADR